MDCQDINFDHHKHYLNTRRMVRERAAERDFLSKLNPKHRALEEALKTERYKNFKPTTAEERLETDGDGNTQADLVAKIREREGEEYYQKWKHWLWSRFAWEDYMRVAR